MNGERHPVPPLSSTISDVASFGMQSRPAPSIIIRRLPRNINSDVLGSMLIFAGDLIDTDFVTSPYPEDGGFATAVARFQSHTGAVDAVQKLNGKPNTTKEANLIVELYGGAMFERRNTIDGGASRSQASSASSGGSVNGPPIRSRYGGTFHGGEKTSPPLPTPSSGASGEFPASESSARLQNLFSPQSPLANGHHRVSGKSVINDDSADDETGDILKDPRAYAENGPRRPMNPQIPVSRFSSLSLSTGPMTSSTPGLSSPRNGNGLQSSTPLSPSSMTSGSNGAFPSNFPRHSLPPVNPADQNPPCNTLYVGNLPIDTSEDELKAIFSKQRGYKRLCFRTKHNGPMCFVEFEDVQYATKALSELYGYPLHNSVKGGIRLSFSKNPLGVRSVAPNGPNTAMSPQAMAPGYGGIVTGTNYSSVSGPPPGLGMPLVATNGYRPTLPTNGVNGMFSEPFGLQSSPLQDFSSQLNPRNLSGGVPPQLGTATYSADNRGVFPDHMMGR
ncbi:hypothetical protein M433DRAFT_64678 [Acidomyces richmondensis BFW]|nr:MAG: hypothetical protein FE78DRAFT_144811 [Acidomyces sp. 'richmondensis']KYG46652.1 hypothetical protein M433DRAFT_64678 [Acidomyces richmondensis BFW]